MHVVMENRGVWRRSDRGWPGSAGRDRELDRRPRSTDSRPSEAGASITPQGALAGERLVPKIVGSKSVGRPPILIDRLSDEDAARLRLRPEGGGTLRGAAPGDAILTTEAKVYGDARTGEDPRDPLAWAA